MGDFEFLNYLPTPKEVYFRGLAIVRLYGKIILKYRVVNKKDGSGYFIAPPSYRIFDEAEGKHKYVDAILIDSSLDKKELMTIIQNEVYKAINTQQQNQQQPNQQQQQPQEIQQPQMDACPF